MIVSIDLVILKKGIKTSDEVRQIFFLFCFFTLMTVYRVVSWPTSLLQTGFLFHILASTKPIF